MTSCTELGGGVAEDSTVRIELMEGPASIGVVAPLVDSGGLSDVASTYAAKGDKGAAAETLMKNRKLDP